MIVFHGSNVDVRKIDLSKLKNIKGEVFMGIILNGRGKYGSAADYEGSSGTSYYGTAKDYAEANREEWEEERKEAEEILRRFYDDISFAKGKEKLMAHSVLMRDSDEDLEWIKNGWMWIDMDDNEVYYSAEGKKRFQENVRKLEGR